jgi:hypothetical protein|tara:strand:- start:309 stop:446 length:138 start_codon:yes stop_codon:yes gene_type:complete
MIKYIFILLFFFSCGTVNQVPEKECCKKMTKCEKKLFKEELKNEN